MNSSICKNASICICSTLVNWDAIDPHIKQFGKEIAVVKGDGCCFLSSVMKALSVDCGQKVQRESLANQVLHHMYENSKYYASFHEDGSARAMLKQAKEFLLCGQYILNVADVCVAATANYLRMNLYIFKNLGGKAVIIQQRSAIEKSTKGLFLRFSHKPTGSCIGNHYDVIVNIETISFHPLVATAEIITTTSILSGTKSEPSHLHPKSKQHLPNLPPLPEPELKPEQQQEFQIKLEPTEPKPEFVPEEGFETKVEPTEPKPEFVPEEGFETKVEPTEPKPEFVPEEGFETKVGPTEPKPEFVPEEGFETKVEPTEPKPEFVPEEGFETKVAPTEPKPEFTIPYTEDSTTLESSMHQLPLILHCPEEEFIPPPAIHRRKWAKSTINMSTFSNITPEVADRMPWIPDGDHIYIIRCEEDYWHDKQIDGYPWQMKKSSHTGLVGIKKFGACRGSFICLNDDCPIYTAEHIRNRVDFMKENFGAYSCSNCKVFVQCRQCNARKVTEFD